MFRKMESISGTLCSSRVTRGAFAVYKPFYTQQPGTAQLLISLRTVGLVAIKHNRPDEPCQRISLLLHCKLPHLIQGGLHSRTVDSFVWWAQEGLHQPTLGCRKGCIIALWGRAIPACRASNTQMPGTAVRHLICGRSTLQGVAPQHHSGRGAFNARACCTAKASSAAGCRSSPWKQAGQYPQESSSLDVKSCKSSSNAQDLLQGGLHPEAATPSKQGSSKAATPLAGACHRQCQPSSQKGTTPATELASRWLSQKRPSSAHWCPSGWCTCHAGSLRTQTGWSSAPACPSHLHSRLCT